MKIKLNKGFTLIELMIVVAVICILTAIALTSYNSYIQRANRGDAKIAMVEAAAWLERQYSLTQNYALQANGAAINTASLQAQPFGQIPRNSTGADVRYVISFSVAPTQNAYILQVVPQNSQSSDNCGTLRMDERQVKSITGTLATVAQCWNK